MNTFKRATGTDDASIAAQTGFPVDAVAAMARSMDRGGGTMAQFDHPAFGGAGQWMRGGMLMIANFSDHALKSRVAQLCAMLAEREGDAEPLARDPSPRSATGWYPAALGVPSSSGAQNRMRYAWFAAARRLAVDDGERVTIYDTGAHTISGVSQQQGSVGTVAFTSQHGAVDLVRLPVVTGDFPARAEPSSAVVDPFEALERLAGLHARGIVSDDEFAAKRIALLERI